MGKSRVSTWVGLACSGCLLAPTVLASFQRDGQADLAATLVLGDRAVTMLPPRSIADWVNIAEWSPTGKYVLYTQTARITPTDMHAAVMGNPLPSVERFKSAQLMSWSKATGKSTKLGQVQHGYFDGSWFAGDETFVRSDPVETNDGKVVESWRLSFINVATGTTRVANFDGVGQLTNFSPNESAPLMAAMAVKNEQPTTVFIFEANGAIRMRTMIPPTLVLGYARWLKDGSAIVAYATERANRNSRKHVFIDVKTGESRVTEINRNLEYQETSAPEQKLDTSIQTQDAFFGSPTKIRIALLRVAPAHELRIPTADPSGAPPPDAKPIPKPNPDEPTTAFIAADVQNARVAPSQDAVLYVQNGVALVRDFAYLPLDTYKQMKEAAQRTEIMSRAKQMGTAMMIYASDYDDMLPGTFDPNAIYPYIKNNSIMEGFIYTFQGGDLSKVANPSQIEMGYIVGPGGRAVVYLDSHVKWIKDPPPVTFLARRANLL